MHFQILWAVIRRIAVAMVNDFKGRKRTAQQAFHHHTMRAFPADDVIAVRPEIALSIAAAFVLCGIAVLQPAFVVALAPAMASAPNIRNAWASGDAARLRMFA